MKVWKKTKETGDQRKNLDHPDCNTPKISYDPQLESWKPEGKPPVKPGVKKNSHKVKIINESMIVGRDSKSHPSRTDIEMS